MPTARNSLPQVGRRRCRWRLDLRSDARRTAKLRPTDGVAMTTRIRRSIIGKNRRRERRLAPKTAAIPVFCIGRVFAEPSGKHATVTRRWSCQEAARQATRWAVLTNDTPSEGGEKCRQPYWLNQMRCGARRQAGCHRDRLGRACWIVAEQHIHSQVGANFAE